MLSVLAIILLVSALLALAWRLEPEWSRNILYWTAIVVALTLLLVLNPQNLVP
jgi:hypothetical protein